MRIRTIKPEFWEHPVMGKQSDATKLMAIGLLNLADDEGYFYADAKLIRNAIRPFDDDSGITTVSIRELSKIDYISIREHKTHGPIGKVESFLSHQVINKPKSSKIKQLYEYGINTVSIPDGDRLEGKGRERKGKEIPPNPQGGIEGEIQKPKRDNTPTTPEAKKIADLYRRRHSTPWAAKEIRAFKVISPIDPDDLDLVCRYTEAEMAMGDNGRNRRDLATFLNNFAGELDRARAWQSKPAASSPRKPLTGADLGI